MQQHPDSSSDVTRTTLGVLFIGALIVGTFWILAPFLSALLWATMIVISTWPLLTRLQARLWGKRSMATAVLTIVLLLVLVIPLSFSVGALVGNTDRIVAWVSSLKTLRIPPPPDWVVDIPIEGRRISAAWQRLASEGPSSLSASLSPNAGRFFSWFASRIGAVSVMVLQFLLTVIISAILYMHGESAARGVRNFGYRLAGPRGERAVLLAASSIRGVAMGVGLTALIQTLVAGIGLAVASVPGALLLSAAILILCLAQVGPALIVIPAVVWRFYTGETLLGYVLLAFSLVSLTLDNFLRPILIRKGANQPLILIFAGVIGGMITLGITGIFVGPAILAVTFDLVADWVGKRPEVPADASPGEASKTAASSSS
jgi:predicted PurR-regulated permease PerM